MEKRFAPPPTGDRTLSPPAVSGMALSVGLSSALPGLSTGLGLPSDTTSVGISMARWVGLPPGITRRERPGDRGDFGTSGTKERIRHNRVDHITNVNIINHILFPTPNGVL